MPLAIQGYDVVLFIHILAVVVGLGVTFGYGVFMTLVQESSPRSLPAIYRAAMMSDRMLVTPALIVILVAGVWLMSDRWDGSESWIAVGLVAVVALLGMTHGYFRPRMIKAVELVERDLAAGDTLSPEFEAVSRQLAIGGQIAGLIIVVTIFFMTVKP